MNFQEIKFYAEDCFRDTPPPCACRCPFNLNIRDLINKVKKGRYGAAFRSYRDAVIFPGVVSRLCPGNCTEVCVRGKHDESINLKLIEEGIVANPDKRPPTKYAIPQKNEKIAIIGAGLSGLACLLRLSAKGYCVTIFEKASTIGGSDIDALPDGVFEQDFENVFKHMDYELVLNTEIDDISKLRAEYDSVYIATGDGGNDFGLLDGYDELLLYTKTPGVFIGGSIIGSDITWSIENGIRAASAIEEYLKIGRNEGMSPIFNKPSVNESFYKMEYDFDTQAESGNHDTEKDVYMTEAERCPECNCSICMDKCLLMEHFKSNPKRMAGELGLTVLPVDEKIKRVASRMLNSCSLCDLCTAVCPAGVDTCEAMYSSRRIMFEGEHLPPAFHDYWIADMEFSMSEDAYYVVAPEERNSDVLFFPGCQLAASSPNVVGKTYEYIKGASPKASMILGCCGIPAEWAADEQLFASALEKLKSDWESLGKPKMLFACSSCMKTFAKHLPEVDGSMIYEWIGNNSCDLQIVNCDQVKKACVYDPCSSRDDCSGQEAVRKLAETAGYELEELDLNKSEAACCGFGGHIYTANPVLYGKIADKRISNSENEYITYCANCRDVFVSKGKQSRHILEVLFEIEPMNELPTLSKRRENRIMLKEKYSGNPAVQISEGIVELTFTPEVQEKMKKLLLLDEDVQMVVDYCEQNNAKILDSETGYLIGYKKGRVITIWVEYEMADENKATIHNVYSHRMEIKND